MQFRRLVVMAEEEAEPHALLALADARRLIASVLAVVEREAGYAAARNVTLCNLLGALHHDARRRAAASVAISGSDGARNNISITMAST